MEFHCTVPVHPNRAQEILCGNTLESFLCGHQIAPALYKRKKTDICAVLTDSVSALCFQDLVKTPVFLLREAVEEREPAKEGGRTVNENGEDSCQSIYEPGEMDHGEFPRGKFAVGARIPPSRLSDEEFVDSLPGIASGDWSSRDSNGCHFVVSHKITDSKIWSKIAVFQKLIDLVEPFERIRLAINESQKTA